MTTENFGPGILAETSRLLTPSVECREAYLRGTRKEFEVFDLLENDVLKYHFVMGLYEQWGEIRTLQVGLNDDFFMQNSLFSGSYKVVNINAPLIDCLKVIEFMNIPCGVDKDLNVQFVGINGLDFLGKLYTSVGPWCCGVNEGSNFYKYKVWCSEVASLTRSSVQPLFRWCKADERAVAPFKARVSDSGFDLTLIDVHKKLSDVTTVYTTGVKIQVIAHGWYFDLVPRSSIIKSGYILSNMVGIIDRGYTGTIFVGLTKVDLSMPDLQLPNRIVQLIPRPIIHGEILEVDDLEKTARNDGGFGSSSK